VLRRITTSRWETINAKTENAVSLSVNEQGLAVRRSASESGQEPFEFFAIKTDDNLSIDLRDRSGHQVQLFQLFQGRLVGRDITFRKRHASL
jgi:hypothetical protein